MKRRPLRGLAMGAMLLALSVQAWAEPPAIEDEPADQATASDQPATPDQAEVTDQAEPLPDEVQAALREALSADMTATETPARVPSSNRTANSLSWKPDGSAAVNYKQPLPTEWDSHIGADLSVAPASNPVPGTSAPAGSSQGSGAAWASVKVPGVASVDGRIEPRNDGSRFGTTVSRSLPVGSGSSLTLQNSFAMTETLSGPPPTIAPGMSTAAGSVWSNDQTVRLNIGATGTTFAAGTSRTSTDAMAHNKLSAEQKLFNDFNVTTSLSDAGTTAASKSITAGFKLRW